MNCPKCGKETNSKFCPECGTEVTNEVSETNSTPNQPSNSKFCKHCGEKIPNDAVICTKCGCQVEELNKGQTQTIINNNVSAVAAPYIPTYNRKINKWVALALCIFTLCGHKFYEGKAGLGVLYLLTFGLFGIGVVVDAITILFKPNPYYV